MVIVPGGPPDDLPVYPPSSAIQRVASEIVGLGTTGALFGYGFKDGVDRLCCHIGRVSRQEQVANACDCNPALTLSTRQNATTIE